MTPAHWLALTITAAILAFLAAEAEARRARRGLWAGRFDLPEIWRRANRGGR